MTIRHEYRISINVTRANREVLEANHEKHLTPGDVLVVPLATDYALGPTPALVEMFGKIAEEHGGVLEHRQIETTQTEWAEPC